MCDYFKMMGLFCSLFWFWVWQSNTLDARVFWEWRAYMTMENVPKGYDRTFRGQVPYDSHGWGKSCDETLCVTSSCINNHVCDWHMNDCDYCGDMKEISNLQILYQHKYILYYQTTSYSYRHVMCIQIIMYIILPHLKGIYPWSVTNKRYFLNHIHVCQF